MEVVFTVESKPRVYRWKLEVKGLSTGKWIPMDESDKRTRAAAEREFRRGMFKWIFDKREWRIEAL